MNTQDILKNLIQRLYSESLSRGFNFSISPYDMSGNNFLQADDGTFLGNISNRYDAKSIFNVYGQHGSRYTVPSIFNPYSLYGSKYSSQSPFNKYTSTPPKIFINGVYFGRLTANKYIPDAKPVDVLLFYVFNQFNLIEERLNDLIELISRMD